MIPFTKYFCSTALLLCTFTLSMPSEIAADVLVEKGSSYSSQKIKEAIHKNDYEKLGRLIRDHLDHKISFESLLKIAKNEHAEELTRALRTTNALHPKSNQLGITRAKLAQAALFCETDLPHYVKKKKHFLPAKKTGLASNIEYDPVSKRTFIHLAGMKGTKIGEGCYKKVTKSIYYRSLRPEIVARAEQKINKKREMELARRLQHKKGMVRNYAITTHRDNGTKKYNIISRLYRPGGIHKVFDQKTKFTLREKMHIAHRLLIGLHQMHSRKIVHRDLGARNYFINVPDKPRGHRKISAVIADLGRAEYTSHAKREKAQGNTAYTSPEGLYFTKMKGKDYLASDVYALGCLLYQFFYERRGPWVDSKYVKNRNRPVNHRYMELVHTLNRYRGERARELFRKKTSSLSPKERFERLILKMIDPLPKKRGDVKEHRKEIKRIMARHKK